MWFVMKNLFVLVFMLLVSFCTVFSQYIDIKSGFFSGASYSYQGSEYKDVERNMDQLKEIMKPCPECLSDLNSFNTKYTIGYVTGFIGGAAVGWPIGGYIGSSMSGRAIWEEYYTPMIIVGGVLVIATVILESSAHSDLEHAEELFNSKVNQSFLTNFKDLHLDLSINEDRIGFGITYSF